MNVSSAMRNIPKDIELADRRNKYVITAKLSMNCNELVC